MSNAIVIRNEMDIMTLGDVLAKSGFFSDSKQASQAVVKVMAGQELGFGPVASMTGINIIQGKVAIGANLLASAIKRSGRYDYHVLKLENNGCTIEFYEGGKSVGISEFNQKDAEAAGVLSKDNWKKFPRNMYFSRALSNGQKWYCPDVGSGAPLYTPEELGVEINGETGEIIEVPVWVVEPIQLHQAPVAKSQTVPADKPYKFPCKAAENFYTEVQAQTSNYYKNPFHMVEVIGGWFNYSDSDTWDAKMSIAVDYAHTDKPAEQEPLFPTKPAPVDAADM
jgi:hypothetical protein